MLNLPLLFAIKKVPISCHYGRSRNLNSNSIYPIFYKIAKKAKPKMRFAFLISENTT
jgi:hypothetical protein